MALRELDDAIDEAAAARARFERDRPTEAEQDELQEAALRGDLGDDMRTLAQRVDAGEDTWDAVFPGGRRTPGCCATISTA